MRALTLYLPLSCLLTSCVSQRYASVQITSTEPMSFPRVLVDGNAVVMCRAGEK